MLRHIGSAALAFLVCAPAAYAVEIPTPLSDRLASLLIETRSIEQTLWRLDEIDAQLRDNFVLTYRSQGAQGATFTNPRALLYTESAGFMLTFNGHASQRGHASIELMEYDAPTSRFVLRDLKLASDANGNPQVVYSQKNPPQCLQCHQGTARIEADPRPNWEPHNRWFGSYGSLDGLLGYGNWFYRRVGGSANLASVIANAKRGEDSNLRTNAMHAGEYAQLDHDLSREAQEYAQFWQLFRAGTVGERYKVLRPRESTLLSFPEAQTPYLTWAIAERNYERIARILRDLPEFNDTKELLRACLQSNNFRGLGRDDIFSDSLELVAWNNRSTKNRFRKLLAASAIDGDGSCLEWIYEPLGYNTSDWSTDFFSGARFAKKSRFGGSDYPQTEFLKIFTARVPAAAFTYADDGSLLYSARDPLVTRARKTLQNLQGKFLPRLDHYAQRLQTRDTIVLASNVAAPEAYGHCIRCHAQPTSVQTPTIPYDDLSALRALGPTVLAKARYRLSTYAPTHLQMPVDVPLSPSEKDELLLFLEAALR